MGEQGCRISVDGRDVVILGTCDLAHETAVVAVDGVLWAVRFEPAEDEDYDQGYPNVVSFWRDLPYPGHLPDAELKRYQDGTSSFHSIGDTWTEDMWDAVSDAWRAQIMSRHQEEA